MELQEDVSSILLKAYKNGKWSDITIINKDKEYRVHKLILSTSIPYFDKMFSSGLSESTSEVIKLEHPEVVFDLIIEWAYGSKILVTKENAVDFFHLADYMNIPKATAECLNFLWNNFSDFPSIDIDHWINQIATEEVQQIIDKYIRSNFSDIVYSDSFLDYDVDTVAYMISLDDLNIENEIQVFEAITRWIQKDVNHRSSHLSKLLKKVHWTDINRVQFMKRIDGLSWIMECNQARPVIMAAIELIFYKSLEQIQTNDLNLKPRQRFTRPVYSITKLPDLTIEVKNINNSSGESIILIENPSLPATKFGDLYVTEHSIDSDVVIRIDWRNGTCRLFKDSDTDYFLFFGRLFQFIKRERKIYFWKGERRIEFASCNGLDLPTSTITKYKGELFLSVIPSYFRFDEGENCDYPSNHWKFELTILKSESISQSFHRVAKHQFVTARPIKMLKSTIFDGLLVIFVDCSLIISYDFHKNTFKEYKNTEIYQNVHGLSFLHFYHGSRLLVHYNVERGSKQVFKIDDGEMSHCLDSVPFHLELSQNPIGFISLDPKPNAN